MQIDIISPIPEILDSVFKYSILGRGIKAGLCMVEVHDLREYGLGKHRQIDDYQFGGGAGMVLMPEPLIKCIEDLCHQRKYDEIIYLSPAGQPFDQKMANNFSLAGNILMICGRYKGIDQRVIDHYVTREVSIGDYVITGGELAAAIIADAVIRLIPGVMSDASSALSDSFQDGLLAGPVYTRPASFRGWEVPDILRSGHEAKVEQWRKDQSIKKTKDVRPDLLDA
jgi:tRNA (guanine37-N1)-methyltransferase